METSPSSRTGRVWRVLSLLVLMALAYVAGLVVALHQYPRSEFNRVWNMMAKDPGVNAWFHRQELSDENTRDVVRPNNDTVYSSAALDLSQGPLLIEAAASDRYWALQFIADNTDVFANVGSRGLGLNQPARVLLVPPGFAGKAPGLTVISSPCEHVWVLARFLVNGKEDLPRVHQVQEGLHISRWHQDQAS